MEKKRYIEEQIIGPIKEHQVGDKVDKLCRKLGILSDIFYNWCYKYAGLEVHEEKRLRAFETKNNKLKKLLVAKLLEVKVMKDVLTKSGNAYNSQSGCSASG